MRKELDQLTQRGTVREYTGDYERICAHIEQHEKDKVHRYLRGLRPRVREALAVHPLVTFDEAVRAAINFEQAVGSLAAPTPSPASSSRMEVDAADVDVELDYVRTNNTPRMRSFGNSGNRNYQQRQSQFTTVAQRLCYNCQQPGHLAFNCRRVCTRCQPNNNNHARNMCNSAPPRRDDRQQQQRGAVGNAFAQ